jgi:deoxyribodipyrimidine photo-lyase
VLIRFNTDRRAWKARLDQDDALRLSLARATAGQTGIDCFDAWVGELVETGWLHNHARMWFASIWIFTLKLPWQLGADFFYKHLMDADPASNTLSWRWVAGLHTRGKHYLARASNIRDNTLQRFDPRGQLDETAHPLLDDEPTHTARAIPPPETPREQRAALLLHDDDLCPESLAITATVTGVACLDATPVGDQQGPAARFTRGAFADALTRAQAHFGLPVEGKIVQPDTVASWAKACGVTEILTPYAPIGLTAWMLDALHAPLARADIRLVRVQRRFDAHAWPHAKSGFFKFKDAIPKLIAAGRVG